MVQSLNFSGIRCFFKVLLNPSLINPHIRVKDIRFINFQELYDGGIRFIAFDKDNCLSAPYENKIHEPFLDAWGKCLKTFSTENVIIISNSAGSLDDHNFTKALAIEKDLGVHVLRHKEKKPGCGTELMGYLSGKWNKNQIAVVGDRLLTDVAFGNLNGFLSIWTRDIVSLKNDNYMAVKIRQLEHRFFDSILSKRTPNNHPLFKNDKTNS